MMAIAIFMAFSATMPSVKAASTCSPAESSQMPSAEDFVTMIATQINSPETQREFLNTTEGVITSIKATPKGKALMIDLVFGKEVNLDKLTVAEKKEMENIFTSNIEDGMGQDVLVFIKSLGIEIAYNFKDQYGHSISGKL